MSVDQIRVTTRAGALIAYLRIDLIPKHLTVEESALLADLAEEGLASLRAMVECGGVCVGEWYDVRNMIEGVGAVSILDRAGAIERKPGEPHLVRFVEP